MQVISLLKLDGNYISFTYHLAISHILDGYSVALQRNERNSFGFVLKQYGPGYFEVAHITPQGSAHKNGKMAIGDNIIAINNIAITKSMSLEMITRMVRESGNILRLTLNPRKIRQGNILINSINMVLIINHI